MKKIVQSLVFLVALVMMMSSCGKWNDTVIKGKIVQYGTGDPVDNAKVTLYRGISGGLFEPASLFLQDSIFTNSNGEFEYRTDADPDFWELSVERENYFTLNESPEYISGAGEQNLVIEMDAVAFLTIAIRDEEPFLHNSFVNLDLPYGEGFIVYEFPWEYKDHLVPANKKLDVFYNINVNGKDSIISNSIQLNPFQQFTYEIKI